MIFTGLSLPLCLSLFLKLQTDTVHMFSVHSAKRYCSRVCVCICDRGREKNMWTAKSPPCVLWSSPKLYLEAELQAEFIHLHNEIAVDA